MLAKFFNTDFLKTGIKNIRVPFKRLAIISVKKRQKFQFLIINNIILYKNISLYTKNFLLKSKVIYTNSRCIRNLILYKIVNSIFIIENFSKGRFFIIYHSHPFIINEIR